MPPIVGKWYNRVSLISKLPFQDLTYVIAQLYIKVPLCSGISPLMVQEYCDLELYVTPQPCRALKWLVLLNTLTAQHVAHIHSPASNDLVIVV